jgi:hypothetical protein
MFPEGVGKAINIHIRFWRGEEMNREMILKLLASLGVEVSTDGKDGTMK